MNIAGHDIDGQRCFIIAEAGTNHMGQIGSALAHAATAHQKGADAVKFQMFVPDEALFCPLKGDERRRDRWNRSAMKFEEWQEVKRTCDALGIVFLASAFQMTTVEWLKKLNVAAYKVASRAARTYPYYQVPGPFIISNGMHFLWQSETFTDKEHIKLQCVMKYPTPLAEARWEDHVGWFQDESCREDGLSDHSGTVWPGLDAMARGCPMLEVHFCIDKDDAGPDLPVCLSPYELSILCYARNAFAEMRLA